MMAPCPLPPAILDALRPFAPSTSTTSASVAAPTVPANSHTVAYLETKAYRLAWRSRLSDQRDAQRMKMCSSLRGVISEAKRHEFMAGFHLAAVDTVDAVTEGGK